MSTEERIEFADSMREDLEDLFAESTPPQSGVDDFYCKEKEKFGFVCEEQCSRCEKAVSPTPDELMEAYARTQAIAFPKWATKEGWSAYEESGQAWVKCAGTEDQSFDSMENLYDIFLEWQSKQQQ